MDGTSAPNMLLIMHDGSGHGTRGSRIRQTAFPTDTRRVNHLPFHSGCLTVYPDASHMFNYSIQNPHTLSHNLCTHIISSHY